MGLTSVFVTLSTSPVEIQRGVMTPIEVSITYNAKKCEGVVLHKSLTCDHRHIDFPPVKVVPGKKQYILELTYVGDLPSLELLEDDCVAYVVAKERSMAQKPKKEEEDKENKGDGDNDSFDYILRKICEALPHGKTAIVIKF